MRGRHKKKKAKGKNQKVKLAPLVILIGIGLFIIFIFRQEISDTLKTREKRKDISREKKMVLLYFSDRDDEYLVGEKREIFKRGEVNQEAKETILELIKGPKGKLVPTLPPRTKLLALRVNEKGVAEVNFSRAFSKDHPGGSSAETMTIYSIVNSLIVNFPQIKKVQILIEGETEETIAGHLSLDQPISSKPDLIKRQ
jgi:spore germination protein GerM